MIDKNCTEGREEYNDECKKHEPYCNSGEYVCPYYNPTEFNTERLK